MLNDSLRRLTAGVLLSGALGAGLTLASAPDARAEVVDRVVAVVNEDVVLLSDLEKARRDVEQEARLMGQPDMTLADEDLLQRLIDERLVRQESRRLNIDVTEKEIDNAIADVMKANRLTFEQLKANLATEGVDLEEYRKTIGEQIRRLKLTSRVVRDRVSIDQSRMQAYYSANRELFLDDPQIRLRRIFFPGQNDTAVAGQLRARLAEQPFPALVTAIAEAGGDAVDFGFLPPTDVRADYLEAAGNLQPGEWSPPLVLGDGVHLVQLVERLEERVKPFSEVKDQIEQRLNQEESQRQFLRWLQELRDRSHVRLML